MSRKWYFKLMRAVWPMLMALVICSITAASVLGQSASKTFTIYENGSAKIQTFDELKLAESEAIGGHMPWRSDPAFVAAVMTADLLPSVERHAASPLYRLRPTEESALIIETPSWRAKYTVSEKSDDRASVDLSINGHIQYRITLEKPVKSWWYVTEIHDLDAASTEKPAGRGEVVAIRPILTKRGMMVNWRQDRKEVSVSAANILITMRQGSRIASVNGHEVISAKPLTLINGHLYASRDIVAQMITAQMIGLIESS